MGLMYLVRILNWQGNEIICHRIKKPKAILPTTSGKLNVGLKGTDYLK